MAKRSTRQKIKDHAGRMLQNSERMLENLQALTEEAAGRSDYITENAPIMVQVINEVQAVILRFRDGL